MNHTQVTLLDRIRLGDDQSWREADRLYRPLIVGWLRQFGFQPNDVDDLIQDVMLTLAREIGGFEHCGHLGAFRGWLKSITVNRVRDFVRRGKRQPIPTGGTQFHNMLEQLEDENSRVSRQFDRSHDEHIIALLLEQIRSEFNDSSLLIFRLHVLEGCSAKQVADQMGVSHWAVYQTKSRVLRRMRDMLGPWTEELGLG